MTIIQLNKNNHQITFLMSILIVALMAIALGGLSLYNQSVDFRHEITRQKNELRQAEVMNAELKNNFYNIINIKNLEPLIEGRSLILDKNPEYRRISQSPRTTKR